LADVSGKGMGAALLASNILSALRILRGNQDFEILDAVKRISSQLHHSSRSGDFATLFAAVLDPSDNTLKFVNAGHNPPLLLRTDGTLKHLDSTGIPIGIFEEFDWKEVTIELSPNEKLVIFTDGITEATDIDGHLYDDDRMEDFLKTHSGLEIDELTEQLLADVNRFVGDAPRSDDMTMILLARSG
jgi:sigma-B regulation protein RsbU (phosphoserine phosphatase)